ncbi:MAG: hypothetical protein M3388_12450 [Acidobacteriota bacterium]|nr:hypothetical protein [Acidobacteriota bacterium]
MKLPISFDEVSYFNNEYRGDLIITKGVLYYFPHTRVIHARYADELGGKDASQYSNCSEILRHFLELFLGFGQVPTKA